MNLVTNPDIKDVIRSVIFITVYVLAISAGAFLLLPKMWNAMLAVVFVGMVLLVNRHKQKTAYRCPHCSHVYEISFLTDLLAPHGFKQGWWLAAVTCPNCHQRKRTTVLKKE